MAIRYGFSIEYKNQDGQDSSMSGGEDSKELAVAALQHNLNYYLGLGYTITRHKILSWDCETCGNSGYLPRPKRGKHAAPWMPRPVCKRCKGTGGEKIIHDVQLGEGIHG